jgi:hypothetical protein
MPNKEVYIFTKGCLTYFNVWMQNMFVQQCKWVRGSPYKVVLNTFEKEKNTREVIRSRYDPRTIGQNTIDGATQTIQKSAH